MICKFPIFIKISVLWICVAVCICIYCCCYGRLLHELWTYKHKYVFVTDLQSSIFYKFMNLTIDIPESSVTNCSNYWNSSQQNMIDHFHTLFFQIYVCFSYVHIVYVKNLVFCWFAMLPKAWNDILAGNWLNENPYNRR